MPSFSSGAICKFWFFSNHRMVNENHLSIVEVLVKASVPLIRTNLQLPLLLTLKHFCIVIDKTGFFLSSFLKLTKQYEWLILFK